MPRSRINSVLKFFMKWCTVAKAGSSSTSELGSRESGSQDNPQLSFSEGSLGKSNNQCMMNLFAVFVFKCSRKNKQTFLCRFILYFKKGV